MWIHFLFTLFLWLPAWKVSIVMISTNVNPLSLPSAVNIWRKTKHWFAQSSSMKAQSKEHIERFVFWLRSGLILSMGKERIFVLTDARHSTCRGSQVPTQAAWPVPWEGTSAAVWAQTPPLLGSGRKSGATRLDGGNTHTDHRQHSKVAAWKVGVLVVTKGIFS